MLSEFKLINYTYFSNIDTEYDINYVYYNKFIAVIKAD